MKQVGRNIHHDSAAGHVSGESVFIDDVPYTKGELYVGWFGSPLAHGRILSLDLSRAAAIPGVVGLYTHEDLAGHNRIGTIIQDEPALAEDLCEYIGQPIVVIAAENRRAMQKARAAVTIDMEELEPAITIQAARAKDAILGWKRRIKTGDPDAAMAAAEHTLKGTFEIGGQEQFYLESQAALAYPGEDGQMVVHSSTQHTTEVQNVVAETLGLGFHQVVCVCKRMGGAFGGKESQAGIPAIMAALAASKTGRPARVIYDKDNDMRITGKRHPYEVEYEAGFTSEGEVTALKIDFYSNGGAYADLSTSVLERTMLHTDSAYYLANAEINATICKTNLPPNTAFRGFGGPQGVAAMENIVEEIARVTGLDSYDIRARNCYGIEERNTTPYGQIVTNNMLPAIFADLRESSDYDTRREDITRFNETSRTYLRGLAMTPVKFGISFTTRFLNQANALVNVYTDGTLQVSTGATEMGQGVNTKLAQIAADEFGVDMRHVIVMPTSTEKNNNTSPTAASAGTDLNGFAVTDACGKIRARLADFAAGLLADAEAGLAPSPAHVRFADNEVFDERRPAQRITFAELCHRAHRERISLGDRGFYATPGVDFNRETGKGNPFLYYTQGAAVCEVLINRFTGDLSVERADILMDLGRMINPGIDYGQTTGAFIQGMGWVTSEELRYSDKGALLSYSPTTYKIPNIQDVPDVFNVDFIENPHNTRNIRGSKAVGEPPLLLGISAWAAARDALNWMATAKDKSTRIALNLPATNEEILTRLTEIAAEKITAR